VPAVRPVAVVVVLMGGSPKIDSSTIR